MPLSGSLLEQLAERLSTHLGRYVDIESATPIGGGSINDAYRLETDQGRFFVKVNSADHFPSMFEAEADGLRRLGVSGAIRVPQVIAFGEDHDDTYLCLEYIDGGIKDQRFLERLGMGLAQLHRNTSASFGLERNNYIGSLRQVNTPCTEWHTFFIRNRLEPLVKAAVDRERLGAGTALRFERLYGRLESLFPKEAPALVHGDLWSGNLMCDHSSEPVLIDPAVHYGHREMDIAMIGLFGGSDPEFIAAYHASFPLQNGWEERISLCNLYPLLVHVVLFGGGYAAEVESALRRFL